MTLPTWPSSVPYKPEVEGFSRPQHHTPLVTSQVEDGPDLMRVQSQTKIKKFAYNIVMTNAEYADFETFAETTLKQGSMRFLMQVPAVGSTYTERQVYIEGGQWTDRPFGLDWEVSFTLCVLPAA